MQPAELTVPGMPDFDVDTHTFSIDGREIPHVTQILNSAGIGHNGLTDSGYAVDEAVMDRARDRGSMVHLACEYYDRYGAVEADWDDDDEPDWWSYLLAYRQFLDDTGYVAEHNELPVYCSEHDYAGIVDSVGWIGDERTVVDIKTGSGLKAWHGPQTAAYAYAIEGGRTWPNRIVLELKPKQKKRSYRIHRFSAESAPWDWRVFLAARTIYTFRQLHPGLSGSCIAS